jgi:hypothetical protein
MGEVVMGEDGWARTGGRCRLPLTVTTVLTHSAGRIAMIRGLIFAATAFALLAGASPALAQYRFDPTVDPSTCRWWQICDYGGRAIPNRIARWSSCPIVEQEHTMPDGRIVVERRRQCRGAIRVRG